MIRAEPAQGRVCPLIKLFCSTNIDCRCIVFHRSSLLKNLQPEKTQILKSRQSSFPSLFNEFATHSFGGIERFLGLISINPWKLTRKVDRRKDTLEFSRADFPTLQTKSIDGQKRPSIRYFFHQICDEWIPRMLFKIGLSLFLFQRFGLSRLNPIFFSRAKIVPKLLNTPVSTTIQEKTKKCPFVLNGAQQFGLLFKNWCLNSRQKFWRPLGGLRKWCVSSTVSQKIYDQKTSFHHAQSNIQGLCLILINIQIRTRKNEPIDQRLVSQSINRRGR